MIDLPSLKASLYGLLPIAATYCATSALGLLLFCVLHRSPLFEQNDILFYRGVMLASVTTLLLIASLAACSAWLSINAATVIGAAATSLSLNLCFLVLVPVTIDRSISVFLLARIEGRSGTLDAQALDALFRREYLGDMAQIDRRVAEQAKSGNIRVGRDGTIVITPQGRIFLRFSRVIAKGFGTDPRFVQPQPGDVE